MASHVEGVYVAFFGESVSLKRLGPTTHAALYTGILAADRNHSIERDFCHKPDKCILDRTQTAKVIHVIIINVRYNPVGRRQMKKRTIALIRFCNYVPTL